MPKVSKYPRLRSKTYRGASGQVYTYYVYDMRPEGKPDVRLGKDFAEAVRQWDELYNRKPRTIGRLQEAFDRWREHELPKYTNRDTRTSYAKNLRRIEPVFGQMVWDEVTVPIMREYLERRTAKSQGNREMALLSVVWGKAIQWGMTRLAWPALGVKKWKNPERARQFEVTDELFAAVYAEGCQVIEDAMDIASATGMRLKDTTTVCLPVNGILRHRAGKTGKWMEFDVAGSVVLSAIVERREKVKAASVLLLLTEHRRPLGTGALWKRWDDARERAAVKAEKTGNAAFAERIRAMYLRDMRRRASDLAVDLDEASKLLQHGNKGLTQRVYRTKAERLRAVR